MRTDPTTEHLAAIPDTIRFAQIEPLAARLTPALTKRPIE
jgi:hypothetical protein